MNASGFAVDSLAVTGHLLWRDEATGATSSWRMLDASRAATVQHLAAPGSGWSIAVTADFDGDQRRDVVWHNAATGALRLWRMNADEVLSATELPTAPGSGWRVAVAADLTNDGRADILWRHEDGRNLLWEMNGAVRVSEIPMPSAPASWQLVAVRDRGGQLRAPITVGPVAPKFRMSHEARFVNGRAGQTFEVVAAGAPTPTLEVVGDLPSGVTVVPSGGGTARIHVEDGSLPAGGMTVTFKATNEHGSATSTVRLVAGPSRAPVVAVQGPASLGEGGVGTFTFTVDDPDDAEAFTVTNAEVTGSSSLCEAGRLVPGSLAVQAGGGSFSCVFTDGPTTASVTVAVTDASGTASSGTRTVSVTNLPPVVSLAASNGTPVVLSNVPVTWAAAFVDQGAADTHTATITWGDASAASTLGSVTGAGFSGLHTYAAPGQFTVTVTVTDDDGGVGTRTATVVVVTPVGALDSVAQQLTAQLEGTSPATRKLLQSALDALVGTNGGVNLDGATDKLAMDSPVAALGKLYDAELALGTVVGPDVSEHLKAIALVAASIAAVELDDARRAWGCTVLTASTCTKGERKSVEGIQALISAGNAQLVLGEWGNAVAAYKDATQRSQT